MNPRIRPLDAIFRMNYQLLLNCFEGVTNQAAFQRPGKQSNSMAFIAAHLVDARHFLVNMLGTDTKRPFGGLLDAINRIDECASLPGVTEIIEEWRFISGILEETLSSLNQEALDRPASRSLPIHDTTQQGSVAFLAQHESYHIGQLAFLRKYFGLGAMSYTGGCGAPRR